MTSAKDFAAHAQNQGRVWRDEAAISRLYSEVGLVHILNVAYSIVELAVTKSAHAGDSAAYLLLTKQLDLLRVAINKAIKVEK